MKTVLRALGLVVLLVGGVGMPAAAQQYVRLAPLAASGSITAAAGEVVITGADSMGTLGVQVTGTFVGTLAPQCSIDGTTFVASQITPIGTTTAVTSVTGTGLWSGSIAGCKTVKIVATAWTSGTAVVSLNAIETGGGGGSGGGGSSVSITQGGNTATVNASNQLSVTCANCSGSGVSVLEDAASANGDAGTPAYAVRQDTISNLTSADGDYAPLKVNSVGRLYVDPSGVTSPVSAASLPLPTGASTSANQTTEITALQLIDNLPNTLGSTTSGQSGALALGAVTTSAPSYTTAQTNALSLDTAGSLRVAITSGAGSGGTSIADDATFTTASTSLTPVGGQYKSARDSVDDNDAGVFAMNIKRAMYISPETPLGVSTTDETAGAIKALLVTAAGVAYAQDTQLTHNVAMTPSSTTGGALFYRSSAAAPTAVGSDDRPVLPWATLSGAGVIQPSYAGVLAATGVGAAGTGVPRVNNTASGTIGAAVPTQADYTGVQDASGNLFGDIGCTASKIYDASTSGNTELVAISGSKNIFICGYEFFAAGTVNVSLVAGTGTACASAASGTPSTGTSGASAALTPAFQFTAQTGKISAWPTHGYLIATGTANALCLKTNGAVAVQAQVFYQQR